MLVGGTPCQGFSIQGLKKGMQDERSALCLQFTRLLRELKPAWCVWENVPGVISSRGGEDFRQFVGEVVKCGYSCAWRVLDARYVRVDGFPRAVPQRRRRVFLVGHFGEDFRYPAEVLFEDSRIKLLHPPCIQESFREGVARDFYQSSFTGKLKRQVVAPTQTVSSTGRLTSTSLLIKETNGRIRFVTPVEVERLFGFPDNWTNVPFKGKPALDSARYKALGNSMCVNVMRWIGMRIELIERRKRHVLQNKIQGRLCQGVR